MVAHFLKHVISGKFIFDQRVSLGISVQTDALTHLVHIVDMIHPFLVNDTKHHNAFQFTHSFFVTDFFFFHFIKLNTQFFQVFFQLIFCHFFQSVFFDVDSAHRDDGRERFAQSVHIPFFGHLFVADVRVNDAVDGLGNHAHDAVTEVFAVEYTFSFAVDNFTLFVHNLVVFQQMFTNGKVIAFYFLLSIFDGFCQHACFDGFIFTHAHGVNQFHGLFGAEQTHEVVFQRDIESGFTGVTLTTGTTTELVVDTSGFMTFCTDDLQTAQFRNAFTQLDVGTTTSHVCCDGNSVHLTSQRNDFRFFCVVFRVQYLMRDAFPFQQFAQFFGFINGNSTYQYRLTFCVGFCDVTNNGTEFACFCAVNNVLQVFSGNRSVCGDFHNVHTVDVTEFVFFCFGCTSHTAFFVVFVEVVLECDGSQCFAFPAYLYIFFCFDCLMQTVGITSAGHHTTGEFVDDNDFPFMNHIVFVQMHVVVCFQGVVDVVLQFQVFGVRQVIHVEEFFCLCDTFLCQHNAFCLFIQNKVPFFLQFFFHQRVHSFFFVQDAAFFQLFYKQIGYAVQVCGLGAAAGNDQWCSGFVDEDGVHFVDDGKVQVTLYHAFFADYHVVTEVVETKFIVGAICDVAGIRFTTFVVVHAVEDTANSQTQETEYFAHPFAVTLCQIVIDSNNVYALAFQCVQIRRQGSH